MGMGCKLGTGFLLRIMWKLSYYLFCVVRWVKLIRWVGNVSLQIFKLLKNGLEETVKWYLENKESWQPLIKKIENNY